MVTSNCMHCASVSKKLDCAVCQPLQACPENYEGRRAAESGVNAAL